MTSGINSELSKWVKGLRNWAGLSIQDASLQLHCPVQELEFHENGGPIPLRRLAKMTEVYGIDPAELMNQIHYLQLKFGPKPSGQPRV